MCILIVLLQKINALKCFMCMCVPVYACMCIYTLFNCICAYTVKPVLVVTSIKQPTCIKQPEESCPKIHRHIFKLY